MLLQDLLKAIPTAVVHGNIGGIDIDYIAYDSRKVTLENGAGTLFVCLPGARVDGHTYAPAVYDKGCRVFLCAHEMSLPQDAVQLVVEDPRLGLSEISAAFWGYPAKELSIIGITGTKGKTTTAHLIAGILSENGVPCAYVGTDGIQIGTEHYETVNTTPESHVLQTYFRKMVDAGFRHVVMEVSSQALKTWRVHGLSFDSCLFTNLGEDHISATEHPDFADYRDCKRRLFFDYPCNHIVTNCDDPHWRQVTDNPAIPTLTYGMEHAADFMAEDLHAYRSDTALGIGFSCLHQGEATPVKLQIPGAFNIYNGLCAIATASLYGITPAQSAVTLAHLSIPGRFEIVETAWDGVTFLIDYAHNGMSLESALTELRRYNPHRLICVIGSIGGRAQNRRRELAEVASRLADISILTSDNPDREPPEEILQDMLTWFDKSRPYYAIPDREEAVRKAVQLAEKGDIVLLAGKGHENYQLIQGEKVPFSEKAILLNEVQRLDEVTKVPVGK